MNVFHKEPHPHKTWLCSAPSGRLCTPLELARARHVSACNNRDHCELACLWNPH